MKYYAFFLRHALAAALLPGLLLNTACSEKKTEGKIAATVNGAAITEEEIDFALRQRGTPADNTEATAEQRRAVLADMVRAELLAQSAVASQLDRKEDWEWAQKLARRQYLSTQVQLQAQRQAQDMPAAQLQEAMARSTQALERRQLLTIEELQIANASEPLRAQIETAVRQGRTLNDIEALAEKAQVRRSRGIRQVGSEQVDPQVLAQLLSAKNGHAVLTPLSNGVTTLLQLRTSMPMPLKGPDAERQALEQLRNQARNRDIQTRLEQASQQAKIEYFGAFAAQPSAR